MSDLAMFDTPILLITARLNSDFGQPCVMGFNPSPAEPDNSWKYLDADLAKRR